MMAQTVMTISYTLCWYWKCNSKAFEYWKVVIFCTLLRSKSFSPPSLHLCKGHPLKPSMPWNNLASYAQNVLIYIFHHSRNCINHSNALCNEMLLHWIILHPCWPISLLFNQCTCRIPCCFNAIRTFNRKNLYMVTTCLALINRAPSSVLAANNITFLIILVILCTALLLGRNATLLDIKVSPHFTLHLWLSQVWGITVDC